MKSFIKIVCICFFFQGLAFGQEGDSKRFMEILRSMKDTSTNKATTDFVLEPVFDTITYEGNNGEEDLQLLETTIKGRVMTAMITPEGDTLIMETLDDISITSLRTFKSDDDYKKYMKFKRYAAKVYPYAKEAIRIFREMEYATENMKKKEKKAYIKQLEEELKLEFEQPLKKLTKLQGKILIKMIEKELDRTMYDLLKDLKGRFKAYTWHNFSKLYSYDLKEGYQPGKYEILDAVLQDFNISYRIEQENQN